MEKILYEIANTIDDIKSRSATVEENISELEYIAIETIQNEIQSKIRLGKNHKHSINTPWDNFKQHNAHTRNWSSQAKGIRKSI